MSVTKLQRISGREKSKEEKNNADSVLSVKCVSMDSNGHANAKAMAKLKVSKLVYAAS